MYLSFLVTMFVLGIVPSASIFLLGALSDYLLDIIEDEESKLGRYLDRMGTYLSELLPIFLTITVLAAVSLAFFAGSAVIHFVW